MSVTSARAWRYRSSSVIFCGWLVGRFPRNPLREIRVVLNRSNRSRLRMKLMFFEYSDEQAFSDIFLANCLTNISASLPMPPVVLNTIIRVLFA